MDIPIIKDYPAIAAEFKYPRSVNIDFRKLSLPALIKLGEYYNLGESNSLTTFDKDELANNIAKQFSITSNNIPQENDVIDKFTSIYCQSNSELSNKNKKRYRSNREILDSEPPRLGEQVAAKTQSSDGSWILGNIIAIYDNNTYEVQDEDDINRTVILNHTDVRRLEDNAIHIRRGDSVLAVFPETTSFYRGIVVKNPKAPSHSSGSGQWGDVIVRFEDDEDETGKAPPRRVPARFVLRCDDVEPEDDDDDDTNE